MKYRIKNEAVEKAVRGLFKTQEDFERELNEACELDTVCVIKADGYCTTTGGWLELSISMDDIEEVVEYDPKVWNEYSKVKPPKKGYFRVELRNDSGEVELRSVEYWDKTFGACYLSPKPLNLFFKPWDDEEGKCSSE